MILRPLVLGLVAFPLACVGSPGDIGDAHQTVGGTGSADVSGTITNGMTTVAEASGATSEDDPSAGSDAPQSGDPCLEFEGGGLFDPCPEGCQSMQIGQLVDAQTCEWINEGNICVSAGDPREPSEYVPYWIELDGQIYGTAVGVSCLEVETKPALLPQCTGGPDDHPWCYCLGVDLMSMQACELSDDCPYVEIYDPLSQPDADCALEALRDRTPAELRLYTEGNLAGYEHWLFVHENGEVTYSRKWYSDTSCFNAASPTMRCTLQNPQYFDDCIVTTDEADKESCLDPANWLLGCAPKAPACE